MKKLLLFVAAVMLLGSASAQDLQKNIYGVRAGVNFSSIDLELLDMFGFRTGFQAGVSYEHLLLKNNPLYLETGLLYSNKGCKYSDEVFGFGYGAEISTSYIEVPIMLNYKFFIGNDITLYPSAGVYYAFGVASKEKGFVGGGDESSFIENVEISGSSSAFGEDGFLKRSDFGYRVGVSATWKNLVLSAGYEGSFMNVAKSFDDGDIPISLKAKNLNIFITLGYNLSF